MQEQHLLPYNTDHLYHNSCPNGVIAWQDNFGFLFSIISLELEYDQMVKLPNQQWIYFFLYCRENMTNHLGLSLRNLCFVYCVPCTLDQLLWGIYFQFVLVENQIVSWLHVDKTSNIESMMRCYVLPFSVRLTITVLIIWI